MANGATGYHCPRCGVGFLVFSNLRDHMHFCRPPVQHPPKDLGTLIRQADGSYISAELLKETP